MVLEIKRLLSKGEYSGNFSFDYQPDATNILIPLCNLEGGVKVEGDYEIFEDGEVEVTLRLSYKLVGQCSYCLKEASENIKFSSDVLFVTDKEDIDNYYYDGNRLDLSKAVNDAMLFSQPSVLLCSECSSEK
ncbi:MAG: YceD family protein [Candidatus Coproplasma sp.]